MRVANFRGEFKVKQEPCAVTCRQKLDWEQCAQREIYL